MQIPDTLALTLAPDVLGALERALAPADRPHTKVEMEIEAVGEGTFTLTFERDKISAKKGFAKAPLVAAVIPKGGFSLIQLELQAALDGFPNAPALQKRLAAIRALSGADVDAALAALAKLADVCVLFEIKGAGAGKFALARGPVDEAGHVLTVALDRRDLERAIAGEIDDAQIKVALSGDRTVLTRALSALAPVVNRLK